MLRAQRHTHGSVRFDKRRKTWNYLWYDAGTRRSKLIGTKQDFPNKAAAWKAVERLREAECSRRNCKRRDSPLRNRAYALAPFYGTGLSLLP